MLEAAPAWLDRVRGCLLGGAAGDALGAAVEFLSRREILRAHGPAGITAPARAYGRPGAITDDTQMTLFTAEGLVRAAVTRATTGVWDPVPAVHGAYLRWLRTQEERAPAAPISGADGGDGWLLGVAALHSARAPGNTCLAALRATRTLGEPARNDSKGCGGVMRVAPVAFCHDDGPDLDPGRAFELGAAVARLTHGHPTGHLAAGHLAATLARLAAGDALDPALDAAERALRERGGANAGETLAAVAAARDAAARGGPDPAALAQLGGGWVAEEALAVAVYAALAAPDFRAALVLAANHDGDSDSTASIAGQILGTRDGVAAIPPDWLAGLELREEIEAVAADLAGLRGLDTAGAARLRARYPTG